MCVMPIRCEREHTLSLKLCQSHAVVNSVKMRVTLDAPPACK